MAHVTRLVDDYNGVYLVTKDKTNMFTDRWIKIPKIYPVDNFGYLFI